MSEILYKPSTYVCIICLVVIFCFVSMYFLQKDSNFLGYGFTSIGALLLIFSVITGSVLYNTEKFFEINGTKVTGEITEKEMDEDGYFSVKLKDSEGSIYNLQVEEETFKKIKRGKVQTLYRYHNDAKMLN